MVALPVVDLHTCVWLSMDLSHHIMHRMTASPTSVLCTDIIWKQHSLGLGSAPVQSSEPFFTVPHVGRQFYVGSASGQVTFWPVIPVTNYHATGTHIFNFYIYCWYDTTATVLMKKDCGPICRDNGQVQTSPELNALGHSQNLSNKLPDCSDNSQWQSQ
jgi:hypothetical protein